jgi:hypothetical protein
VIRRPVVIRGAAPVTGSGQTEGELAAVLTGDQLGIVEDRGDLRVNEDPGAALLDDLIFGLGLQGELNGELRFADGENAEPGVIGHIGAMQQRVDCLYSGRGECEHVAALPFGVLPALPGRVLPKRLDVPLARGYKRRPLVARARA